MVLMTLGHLRLPQLQEKTFYKWKDHMKITHLLGCTVGLFLPIIFVL